MIGQVAFERAFWLKVLERQHGNQGRRDLRLDQRSRWCLEGHHLDIRETNMKGSYLYHATG